MTEGRGGSRINPSPQRCWVIPIRQARKKGIGVDRSLYRLRDLLEYRFNMLKKARRVARRYDKTAESFLEFIDITSIRLWLWHLST